jgi:hypothetical protein
MLTLLLLPQNDDNGYRRDEFTRNMPGVLMDTANLVVRALELMRCKFVQGQVF